LALYPAVAGVTKEEPPFCAFRVAGRKALAETSITHKDVDHLMIHDVSCSLPGGKRRSTALKIWGLCARRGRRRADQPGIPLNTNGGGLS
jgi:hypothetical protein